MLFSRTLEQRAEARGRDQGDGGGRPWERPGNADARVNKYFIRIAADPNAHLPQDVRSGRGIAHARRAPRTDACCVGLCVCVAYAIKVLGCVLDEMGALMNEMGALMNMLSLSFPLSLLSLSLSLSLSRPRALSLPCSHTRVRSLSLSLSLGLLPSLCACAC